MSGGARAVGRAWLALLCVTACSAAAGAMLACAPAFAAAPAVAVFPIPGGHEANPATQITFRGIAAKNVGTVTVRGSKTGVHAGKLKADSDGHGASFIPATPFAIGETVAVSTGLNVIDGSGGGWSFTVADPAGLIPLGKRASAPRVRGDVWQFHSVPTIEPAAVKMYKTGGGTDDIFLTPTIGPVQDGPELLSPTGQLIWFQPAAANVTVTDFRVQNYEGQRVLTWWQGNTNAGHGRGVDIIENDHYQQIAEVQAANGVDAGLHEFYITPQNTAMITATEPMYVDVAGQRRIINDSVVQEIDIKTGLVLFQWDSLDHIPLSQRWQALPAYTPTSAKHPYDYFHINSIEEDYDGSLLISARDTWAVYKVSHQTGKIIWTLGGKNSSFKMGRGASFAFQHDAEVRARGDRLISMFDDGAGLPIVHQQSRGLELSLDFTNHTASVVHSYQHSPGLLAFFEGSYQWLPGNDAMIGWGSAPWFTDYTSSGQVLLDGRFVGTTYSYRAYRFAWTGAPLTPPAVVASQSGTHTIVYASWNGATAVTGWKVFAGAATTGLRQVAHVRWRNFETSVTIPATKYVYVQALGTGSKVLSHSVTIPVG